MKLEPLFFLYLCYMRPLRDLRTCRSDDMMKFVVLLDQLFDVGI